MVSPVLQRTSTATSQVAPIQVLVVDDHPAVRRGARMLIDDEPDMHVTAEARSAEEALAKLPDAVDVAVVDYNLGGGRDGLWLTVELKARQPGPRVLIYSAFTDVGLAASALIAGADGLVGKHELGQELSRAVRTLARGGQRLPMIPASVAQAMRARLQPRDQAILGMLVDGLAPDVVADRLQITHDELHRRRRTMLRALTPARTAPEPPNGARAPLDYERRDRGPRRRAA